VSLPDAKFRVIVADPPWKYGNAIDEAMPGTTVAESHYPCLSIAELCALPVGDRCEDDAVLFLWVTSPLLFEAAPVIKAWGFTYKTSFVWDKVKHNVGFYNSVRHEFLLVCTRGSGVPDTPTLFDSVVSIERTAHSVKPQFFYDMISELYTHGKKLELFARAPRDGWAVYGNEL
jgi:N6-adenosine-specific RNA methylase IME4